MTQDNSIPVHLQFCLTEENIDITGSPYAETDATEVRLWHEDATNIATVRKLSDASGQWEAVSSDEARYDDLSGNSYGSWQDAMNAILDRTIYAIPSH
jgi:hypothetical protein